MPDWEAELVRRTATGDAAALEVLYRRYVDRVWRYGWWRTHSRDAASDIVQETFLRVARAAADFKAQSSFATWLFAIARSAAVDHLRRNRRDRPLADAAALLRLAPEDDAPPDDGTRREVRAAVASLPGAQRDAIVLCELMSMPIREAARVLGWGESRVKVTVFRARRKLREKLKGLVSKKQEKQSV